MSTDSVSVILIGRDPMYSNWELSVQYFGCVYILTKIKYHKNFKIKIPNILRKI